MPLTIEQKLDLLLALPWQRMREETPEGDRLLRVVGVPSAVGSGETLDQAESDLRDSLRESLRAYLHFGDVIPLPAGAALPWSEDGSPIAAA